MRGRLLTAPEKDSHAALKILLPAQVALFPPLLAIGRHSMQELSCTERRKEIEMEKPASQRRSFKIQVGERVGRQSQVSWE